MMQWLAGMCTFLVLVPYAAAPATGADLVQGADVQKLLEETVRDMVTIPAGTLNMGSPVDEASHNAKEGPQHTVSIRAFKLAAHSVTRSQWAVFVAATSRPMPPDDCSTSAGKEWSKGANWLNPGIEQSASDPVVCVNWHDAQDYVRWLSAMTGNVYRLPTEAEREYAARAGTTTAYFTGETITQHQANFDRVMGNRTSPVGSYPPNAFGLYDMAGNVWEWTEDCFNATYDKAPADGSAWLAGQCDKRAVRGGSWNVGPSSIAAGRFHGEHVRSASRDGYASTARYARIGFRVANPP